MKHAVLAAYKGLPFSNRAQGIVHEYIQRQKLAKLGFVSDLSKLSAEKAEAFCLISSEVERLQNEDMKNKTRR